MPKQTSPRCHFTNCRKPVTHTVQRLWKSQGKTLPMTYCCEAHIPGSRSAELPSWVQERLAARPFYHVEPLPDAT